ncbi:hypothetical protein FPV67DRAFT_1464380 [Lyophyllum atratum]|nr:hypothetical protein FPV67DRAFT_1464380 [Lyophyllum atratum]
MSTTMLETFDTQMLDYHNDPDFSMHLSSSDSWFQDSDEATMEDDGRALHHENLDTSIEVDMEPYEPDDTHNPEYEMDDGSENLDLDTAEIVDVEVYDASRAPSRSPGGIHVREIPAIPASDSDHALPIQPQFSEPSPPHSILATRPEGFDTFSLDTQYRSASPLHPQLLIGGHPTVADVTNGVAVEEPFSGENLAGKEQEPDISADEVEHESYQPDAQGEVDFDPSSASTGDPHEISEGVYIDPPPPVLISLSVSSPSISLFNAPSKSRQSSPSNDGSTVPDLVVLLGHLPTLYYEPLSSVFEALRQEEHLSRIHNLLNGELLLDAYDLELVVSEDHTFAHELSLHDLNVLHDGLNKPGPLRLRLRTVIPRFIDRYHMLQEQIAQFQINDSKDVVVEHSDERIYEQKGISGDTQFHVAPKLNIEGQHEQDQRRAEEPEDDQHSEGGKLAAEDHLSEEAATTVEGDHDELEYVHASENIHSLPRRESIVSLTAADHTHQEHDEQHDEPEEDAQPDTPQDVEGLEPEPEDPSNFQAVVADDYQREAYNKHGPEISGAAPNPPTITTPSTRNENPQRDDNEHFDPTDLHDASGEARYVCCLLCLEISDVMIADSVPPNLDNLPDAELGLTTNLEEEPDQAGSSAGATLVVLAPDVLDAEDASYELDQWDDTLDGEGDPDTNWEAEEQEHETASNLSSVTLSSKTSTKRSLSEAELEEYEDEGLPPSSPDPKRPRVV